MYFIFAFFFTNSHAFSDKMPLKRKHSPTHHQLPLTDLANSDGVSAMKRTRRSSCISSERLMPDILNASTEFGSPHKFWTSLCEKDEAYFRNPDYMQSYSELEPHMRRTLISWIMDVSYSFIHLSRIIFWSDLGLRRFDTAPRDFPFGCRLH
jgi:hypothetical protein